MGAQRWARGRRAPGHRSAQNRRQPDMRLRGRSRAPISMGFGIQTAAAITSQILLSSRGRALRDGGAEVGAGQAGAWTPIGAEQTATGYEVAWKVTGADQYGVWNTDSSGNYISNTAVISGASAERWGRRGGRGAGGRLDTDRRRTDGNRI